MTDRRKDRRKYPTWGDFLKENRTQRFRSAREFCSAAEVGISYPQYSRYEAGEQLPNLDQALKICRLLGIPFLEGILHWCRAQLADPGDQAELLEKMKEVQRIEGGGSQSEGQPSDGDSLNDQPGFLLSGEGLNKVLVFNKTHLRLFSSHPAYRDIFTYINSYAPEWITSEELSQAVDLTVPRVEAMLEELNDLGVILLAGGRCRAAKKGFYFPDDEDFFELRNRNFDYEASALMKRLSFDDLQSRRAFRGVVTRELTAEQLSRVLNGIERLMRDTVALPETQEPDQIYSLGIVFGERFSRTALAKEKK
jgi:transcriptional regulator with XRE-family HTH domain